MSAQKRIGPFPKAFLFLPRNKLYKMKKIAILALALIAMACQENKIGFVDSIELMEGYQERIDLEARFKVKAETMGKKRDSIAQSFQLELQNFQARAEKMSQKNAQEEYGQLQQRGQSVGQQLQQEEQLLQQGSQTEMDSLVGKVKKEIQAYGKAQGYTYILGGGDGGAVLYGEEAHDLTDVILKILNDNYQK